MESSNFALLLDSNSALYDSLDTTSFHRRLDAATTFRSLSDSSLAVAAAAAQGRKKQFRFLRSLQKLKRLVFGSKPRGTALRLELSQRFAYGSMDESEAYGCTYPVRWSGGGLASIPELSEKGMESPELDCSVLRRAVSERFMSSTSGVLLSIPAI